MTPDDALNKQIELYRGMSGEQQLKIALDLHTFIGNVSRSGIRRRYTLCSSHFNEGHAGDWKDCKKCRDSFETEMYVYYGTNEYNFEVLPDPPTYEPTKCADCGEVIILGDGGYSMHGGQYRCGRCTARRMRNER